MKINVRRIENFHIVLWLMKDACWAAGFKLGAMFMIVPTIGVAMYITLKSKKHYHDLMHNLAVVFWIAANSVWMIGEFSGNTETEKMMRQNSLYVFGAGFIFIIIYYSPFLFYRKSKS